MSRRAFILVAVGLAVAAALWWRSGSGGGNAVVDVKMPALSASAKEGRLFSPPIVRHATAPTGEAPTADRR